MATIFAGIILLILGGAIVGWIGFFIALALIVVLILMPLEGYEERDLEDEIPLIKLKRFENEGGVYYAEKSKYRLTIAYDNRETYDIDYEAYEEKTVVGIIKIYESEECREPTLRTFKSIPSRDAFTFCPFNKIEYVLMVPKDTVLYKKGKKVQQAEIVV